MTSTFKFARLLPVFVTLCLVTPGGIAPARAQGPAVGTVTDLVGEAVVTRHGASEPQALAPSVTSCSKAIASTPKRARGCGSGCATAPS